MPTPQNPATITQPIGAPVMSYPGMMYSTPMPGSISASAQPMVMGSVSMPIAAPHVVSLPVSSAVGGIPAVGARQYPEGQSVGTLPYEVPPYPEGTELTDDLCRALQVPRGTLWGAPMGENAQITTQEV